MPDFTDSPTQPRDAERLDEAALASFLTENLEGFAGELELRQFRKGHSNLTYAVSDGTREWVLRRGPFGSNVKTAHDMGREYRILSTLWRELPAAPRALLYCEDADVIGAPFYVMERVTGIILRDAPPKGLRWNEGRSDELCRAFLDTQVAIHSADLVEAGLSEFGRPAGYTQRQVEGWTSRYSAAKTDEIAEMESAAAWLAEKMPGGDEGVLIHNDLKFDNIVLNSNLQSGGAVEVIGVLDWEMATVGHPLMDLGTTLSYWLTPDDGPELAMMPFGVTGYPGAWSREKLVGEYGEATGRDVSAVDFYHVFGLFKTAVVAQQIYYRFHTGKTDDPRFQMMIVGVNVLSRLADRIVSRSAL